MNHLTLKALLAVAFLTVASSASAFWGSNNHWNGFGNPYDEWDPRYWAEEMEDFFNDNDYGPRGFAPYGGGYGYAPYQNQFAPQAYGPYGYAQPPQATQAPYGYPAQ